MQYFKGVILLVLSCVIFSGCVPANELLRYTPEAEGPLYIGAVLPLSGADASYGKKMLNGAAFAIEKLNSGRGHFGRRVEMTVFDSGSTAEGAARAFAKAVKSGAVGIVGGYSTLEVQGMTAFAAKHRVPLVIPMATGNDVAINANKFVYRTVFTDDQQAAMIAGYLKYYRQVKRLIITAASEPEAVYSRNVAGEVAKSFREMGGGIVTIRELNGTKAEQELREIASLLPDAVLLPFDGKTAARYYKILRQCGYNGLICGPDSWDDPSFFRGLEGLEKPGNSFYTALFNREAKHSEYKNFQMAFRKKLYYLPESCEIQTYDAVNCLLAGFGKNATSLKQFQKNWCSLRKYAGAAAVYTMYAGNKIDRTIYINRVGIAEFGKNKFVPRNIIGLQSSRLKDYAIGTE